MGKVIHVIPIGFNKERVIESIKVCGYPIHKAYLVLSRDQPLEIKRKILETAEEVEKTLKALIDIERIYINELDIYGSAIELLKVIKKEIKEGNDVLINASDAPRTVCIACYITAQISNSKMYIAIPKYEDGKEVGIEKIVEIPIPPLKRIGEDKIMIIKTIEKSGGEVESINKLIELLEGRLEDQKRYMAQRARMSYHLKGLEEDGIVVMKREGKNVKIALTELGKAYAMMFD